MGNYNMKSEINIVGGVFGNGGITEGDSIANRQQHERIFEYTCGPLRYSVDFIMLCTVKSIHETSMDVEEYERYYEVQDVNYNRTHKLHVDLPIIESLCKILQEHANGKLPNMSFQDMVDLAEL